MDTFFRQYTTSIPKMADGSAFPRYWMNLGVGFLDEKTTKGRNLVAIVPATQRAIVMICSDNVMVI